MVKDHVTTDLLRDLQRIERSELAPRPIERLLRTKLPWMEIDVVESLPDVTREVLAGQMALLVDGEDRAVLLDLREFPVRSIDEPDLERVTRGSREGLVETIVFSTALIRRRLRDPRLRFEMLTVGEKSPTPVAIAYVKGVASESLVGEVRRRIQMVRPDALPMGARSLEDLIVEAWWNPLPTVRYTERPDVAAAHLMEGHAIVLVDTTPMAMIMPATLWHFTEHAEEYFQKAVTGTWLRWVRLVGILASLTLTPLWLALFLQQESLPEWLSFIGPPETDPTIPIPLQLLLLEIGIDLIRQALIHTPNALATSLGIVGAILLGELAVEVGLFSSETILYTAIVALGTFATPSLEFSLAVRILRLLALVATISFGMGGLAAALALAFFLFASTRSFGVPYLWPLIPFQPTGLLRLLFRRPVTDLGEAIPFPGRRKNGSGR